MAFIKNILDSMKPTFSEGGKLSAFGSLFEAAETFFYVPNETAKATGAHIHDAIDSKRGIFFVIIALLPAILFGMYNVGLQHYSILGEESTWLCNFLYGLGAMLPKIIVAYVVGLGIEVAVAQWKKEEVHEGFFVTGILIPMIVPVNCPLWILAIATAFATIFAKEVFGGTGMNIFNPALVTRAFLFFAYPSMMTGDKVWVNGDYMDCINGTVDGVSAATPLGQLAAGQAVSYSPLDTIIGTIPGSVGETSFIAILIGAVILIWAGIASWKIIVSVFAGGAVFAYLCQYGDASALNFQWWEQLTVGGFAFGAVFMATDPVTACRTEKGKYIYGFFIGALAIIVRLYNPGYPEGMMMAILMGNLIAPLIDYCFVQSNINKRLNRAK